MAIYTTEIKITTGKIVRFAVEVESEFDAKQDLTSAIMAATNFGPSMFRIKEIKKATRRILATMEPVKKCTTGGKVWAWVA